MFYLQPSLSPGRHVPTMAGVPESQAKDLDRRRRLNRQLLTFRAIERVAEARPITPLPIDPAVPDPA